MGTSVLPLTSHRSKFHPQILEVLVLSKKKFRKRNYFMYFSKRHCVGFCKEKEKSSPGI